MDIELKRPLAAVAAAAATLALAACGSSSLPGADNASTGSGATATPTTAQRSAKTDSKLRAMLPESVRSRGVLRVATDASYAPFELVGQDGDSIVGFDPDLGAQIGKLLGLRVKFSQVAFDGLIPALQSGRFDLVMAGMNDTVERQRAVDFIDYFHIDKLGMIVPKGNPDGIHTLMDLCGKTVAVQKATAQLEWVQQKSKKCGKPMNIAVFPAETDAQLQVRTRRAAADVTDYTVATYVAGSAGGKGFGVVPTPYVDALHGIAVAKDQTQLRDAVQQAVQRLMDDGTYASLLKRWDLHDIAIDRATIDKGTA